MIKAIINFIITVLVVFVFAVIVFGFAKGEYSDLNEMIDYILRSFKWANNYFWSFVNSNFSPNIIHKIQEFKYNITH